MAGKWPGWLKDFGLTALTGNTTASVLPTALQSMSGSAKCIQYLFCAWLQALRYLYFNSGEKALNFVG